MQVPRDSISGIPEVAEKPYRVPGGSGRNPKTGKPTRLYTCPIQGCPDVVASSNNETIKAHYREFHSGEWLICGAGDRCVQQAKGKGVFASYNGDSMRNHMRHVCRFGQDVHVQMVRPLSEEPVLDSPANPSDRPAEGEDDDDVLIL